tara:strand:- start:908 stop:1156 length:249 start_codon:yes stop_codon:yes gene_type:complete
VLTADFWFIERNRWEILTRVNSKHEASGSYHKGNKKNVGVHDRGIAMVLDILCSYVFPTSLRGSAAPYIFTSDPVHGSQGEE